MKHIKYILLFTLLIFGGKSFAINLNALYNDITIRTPNGSFVAARVLRSGEFPIRRKENTTIGLLHLYLMQFVLVKQLVHIIVTVMLGICRKGALHVGLISFQIYTSIGMIIVM